MRYLKILLVTMCMLFLFAGCGDTKNSPSQSGTGQIGGQAQGDPADSMDEVDDKDDTDNTDSAQADAASGLDSGNSDLTSEEKILIAYFSRADENYGVGVIEKGNTEMVAEMIAEKTNGSLFHIETEEPYPTGYEDCKVVAQREQRENARPEIKNLPESLDGYDVIFIGYPIWYGDMPMALYTFMESYDFSGKMVIPFCTHAGSGLSGTVDSIRRTLPDAVVKEGLGIRGATAQNDRDTAQASVESWLSQLGY